MTWESVLKIIQTLQERYEKLKKKKEKVGYEMSIQKPTVFLYKGATEDEMVGWHY